MSGRVVTRKDGAKWVERDLGGGVVERTYLVSPDRYSAPIGTVRIADSTTTLPPPKKAAAPPKRKPSRKVPLRHASGPGCGIQVLISDEVIETIARGILWTTGTDGLEAGGWIAGTGLENEIYLLAASVPSESDKRSEDGTTLSPEAANEWDKLRQSGDHRAVVAQYHSHPDGAMFGPSLTDFRSWESCWEHANKDDWQPFFCGLIVTSDEGRWAYPKFDGWVTQRNKNGALETAPAEIRRMK